MKVWVRAMMLAAWSASLVGAASFAILFTLTNIAFGIYEVAEGHTKVAELPGALVGGLTTFVLVLLFSFAITVPVSLVAGAFAYLYLNSIRDTDRRAFGIVGFVVGTLIWFGLSSTAPAGNFYFGSWISVFVIGGLAGCAGGLAFYRQLRPSQAEPKPCR
jgi:hypothetical protein